VRAKRSRRTILALVATLISWPGLARAQAWLPDRGEGSVSLTVGDYAYDGHFDSDGSRDPFGGTHARSVALDLTYGLTGRLAISAGLPFVDSRLSGSFPRGVPLGPLDDGKYHGDFQDFRVELRYMLTSGKLAVTPFVGTTLPSHNYEVIGEAVPGKRIKEALLGVSCGLTLEPVLPQAYVHVRYSFAYMEKALADTRNLDRSNVDAELGYSPTPRLTLRSIGAWQVTHGGLDLEDMRTRPNFFRDHDRAARTNYFNFGGGLTYDVSETVGLYGVCLKTLSGQNAHQARSFYLGASFSFGGGFGEASGRP
jgi:hypothetical protein